MEAQEFADNVHTLKFFGQELRDLRLTVGKMGELARMQVAHAAEAIGRDDAGAARDVTDVDEQMHALKRELDRAAVRIISLRQPVAHDLRLAISAIRMSSLLERVGDLANNTAKRAAHVAENEPDSPLARAVIARVGGFAGYASAPDVAVPGDDQSPAPSELIERMGELVCSRLGLALAAYVDSDTNAASAVWNGDREIDERYEAIVGELLACMIRSKRCISRCSQLLFAVKNFERIGDYAVNIADIANYVVTGEEIEGERPKGDCIATTPSVSS